jgi:tetratricopeptide (TPR) repeat protein
LRLEAVGRRSSKESETVSGGKVHLAKSLQVRGRVAEAEALYREVLRDEPGAALALEGLGVLVFQQGRAAEAAELFARGVALCPNSARFHANLGEALRSTERPDQALPHLRRATELDPTLPHAWNSLALLAYSEGRFAESEASCREAIRLSPSLTAAYINLGNALSALERPADAAEALRAGLRIEPHNPLTLMNLAWALCELNDPALLSEAESLCRRAVALAPQVPTGHKILGNILRSAGRHDEARACFARAGGGHSPHAGTEPDAAAAGSSAGKASQVEGMAQLQQGRLDLAEASFRNALRLEPKLAAAWNGIARIHAERGDFEASCAASRTAISLDSRQAEAYLRLATDLKGRLSDVELDAMQGLLDDKSLSNDDRALVGFAVAAVLEHRGLFDRAAARLSAAHACHSTAKAARGLTFDPEVYTRLIEQIKRVFTPDFLARRQGWGAADHRPVFIVGLPRSGTTLTEQIVASHPLVHGAGELSDVQRVFSALPAIVNQPSQNAFDAVSSLDPVTARAAAQQYLDRLNKLAPGTAERVVDKNPENIQFLGLIALLWPDSRVILCRRDPRDIAVSCWRTSLPAVPWSSDWDHIARHVADYQRLLEHWRNTRPLEWLDLDYEELVGDLEGQSRRLVEFLGLDWDPACLSFHLNRRVVRTPSLVQVRQPVYSDSVGIWRKYEPYLAGLFEAFERHGIRAG